MKGDEVDLDILKGLSEELIGTQQGMEGSRPMALKTLQKSLGTPQDEIRRCVKASGFFELVTTKARGGLFGLKEIEIEGVEFASSQKIKENYHQDPEGLLTEASSYWILSSRLYPIVWDQLNKVLIVNRKQKDFKGAPKVHLTRHRLLKRVVPDYMEEDEEGDKRREAITRRFMSRVSKGSEFRFDNGKVATSIQSWAICVLESQAGTVAAHLSRHDFDSWLRLTASSKELAAICSSVSRDAIREDLSVDEQKQQLLRRILVSPMREPIFKMIVEPLVQRATTGDLPTSEKALEQLEVLVDDELVQLLASSIFKANPENRGPICSTLGRMRGPKAIPYLEKMARFAHDESDRKRAMDAISSIGGQFASEALDGIGEPKP